MNITVELVAAFFGGLLTGVVICAAWYYNKYHKVIFTLPPQTPSPIVSPISVLPPRPIVPPLGIDNPKKPIDI